MKGAKLEAGDRTVDKTARPVASRSLCLAVDGDDLQAPARL